MASSRVVPCLRFLSFTRVWDLVARGYLISGGREPEGVGQALAFRVARCQTWPILDSGQSPVMSYRDEF